MFHCFRRNSKYSIYFISVRDYNSISLQVIIVKFTLKLARLIDGKNVQLLNKCNFPLIQYFNYEHLILLDLISYRSSSKIFSSLKIHETIVNYSPFQSKVPVSIFWITLKEQEENNSTFLSVSGVDIALYFYKVDEKF
jgi:hypothetical protein